MENKAVTAVRFDNTAFRPAPEAGHPRSGQPLAKIDRKRSAKIRAPRLNTIEPTALQHLFQAADSRFNFGKLRHAHDMADAS